MNPNNLTNEQVKQGFSTIEGAFNPVTGQLKSPSLITPEGLATPNPINLQGTQANAGTGADTVAGAGANIDTFAKDQQTFLDRQAQATPDQSGLNDILSQLTGAEQGLTGRGQAQLDAEAGINQMRDLRATTTQPELKTALAEYEALKRDFELQSTEMDITNPVTGGRDIRASVLFGQQGALEKRKLAVLNRKASDIGLIEARDLALSGRIDEAQKRVDRAIDLKYADREAVYQTKVNQYNRIKEDLTKEEKKRGDAMLFALNKEKAREDEVKQTEKDVEKLILESTPNAPADVIANAKKIADGGGTPVQVAQALGKYGGDFLKSTLLKQQIETEKAQRNQISANIRKINADTAKTQKETSLLDGTPGLGKGLDGKPLTEAQVLSTGYAERVWAANQIIDSKAETFKKMTYIDFKLINSGSTVSNKFISDDTRQAAQAMRNFITAKLRKESGASISDTEFAEARRIYFPSFGDDNQTLINKKQSRDQALANFGLGSNGGFNQPVDTNNKYSQSLGANQTIEGTSIISSTGKDGSLIFNVPTK